MKKTLNIKLIFLHLLAWVLFIGLMILTAKARNANYKVDYVNTLYIYSQAALIFYGSNYLFFKLLPARQYLKLFIAEVVFFLLISIILSLCEFLLRPVLHGEAISNPTAGRFWWYIISTVFWLYALLSVLSLGYYFARRTVIHQSELRLAEKNHLLAEKGRLEAEHAFLRAQINPHFLYNTLNFFYAKSLGLSPELSEGILILNDIMRYSLESGEDNNGLVLLRNEAEHVENVIRLHQLRFSNRLKVNFFIKGEVNSLRIVPLVLITLVENAFKHGDLTCNEHPVSFNLAIADAPRQIVFNSFNKKKKGPLEAYSGIGLVNIQKRLAAAYGDAFTLKINEDAGFYQAELKINLNNNEKNA